MPGGQNSAPQPLDGVDDSVFWTNASSLLLSSASCSGTSAWFWSEVKASELVSRCGLDSFGLSVSSGPIGPEDVISLYRPLTLGVPGLATNGVPSVFGAYG